MVDRDPTYGVQRRVAGSHDLRLDGVGDILGRVRGMSVLDLGCNRGMVSLEAARNGASLVHGCDVIPEVVHTCREVFADVREFDYKFEVVDLTQGFGAVERALGRRDYDVTFMLATLHKLRKQTSPPTIEPNVETRRLLADLGGATRKYFVWRGAEAKNEGNMRVNEAEMKTLDEELGKSDFVRVQTSIISEIGPAAIWRRGK